MAAIRTLVLIICLGIFLALLAPVSAAAARNVWSVDLQIAEPPSQPEQAGTPAPPAASLATGISVSAVLTDPITVTATATNTATLTPTVTVTPTETTEPTPAPPVYLGLLSANFTTQEPPPVEKKILEGDGFHVPDNTPSGASSSIFIDDSRFIVDVDVQLLVDHNYVGDLSATLTHVESGRVVTLVDRPGRPDREKGCNQPGLRAILDDEISLPIENRCAQIVPYPTIPSPAAIAGIFKPETPLSAFDGDFASGTWVLNVSDGYPFDDGNLRKWRLIITLGSYSQVPWEQSTPPPALPVSAYVANVPSVHQALPLDCESRVAVDWARFFGVHIGEFEFFYSLPVTDNPDTGFVGPVDGVWGQVPPNPYGIHAEPIAAKLREFGVSAYAHRPLAWDDLRAEIAAGRPVYVWTPGAASRYEEPIFYSGSDGRTTVVAHYEHTIMVVGYSENRAIILDGGIEKSIPLTQFLTSWSALGNMAITAIP